MSKQKLSVSDLISIQNLNADDIRLIFTCAQMLKEKPLDFTHALSGKNLALIFEKPSLRTRVTFDIGMTSMGGSSIFLDHSDTKLGERESIKDVARNLERWVDGIVARTYKNKSVIDLAEHARIPVINGLTDLLHPCQALADFFTIYERFGNTNQLKFCFVGDGNNTCHSLMLASALLGIDFYVAAPSGFAPNADIVDIAKKSATLTGASIIILTNPNEAVKQANIIYTDVWASMGQEAETEQRASLFADYQVNDSLMNQADENVLFMHCLPAHRGYEVASSVIDSNRSIVYEQAENRLHVQKALLYLLLSDLS